ncbi:MAG: tetratricopeptide repeat protein [Verrucomicrobiota bacterium]
MDRAPMATVRFASQLALSAAFICFCLSPRLCNAAKAAKSSQSQETEPALTAAPVSKTPARLVFADPFPSPPEPISPDLLLSSPLDAQNQAIIWFTLGTLAEEQGEVETALGYFQKSLDLAPGNLPLAIQLAAHYVQQQQPAEALRILKDAQQANPTASAPLVEIARIHLTTLHQPDNALAYAEKAYKLAPDQFPAISIFVEVCTTAKLSQKVDDIFKKTESLTIPEANFWLSAGDLFRNAYTLRSPAIPKTTLERINGLFKKALNAAPRDPRCLDRAADHYALTGQLLEAGSFYQRAQLLVKEQTQSNSPTIAMKWARTLAASEKSNLAIEMLEDLLREQPLVTTAREMAADFYIQQGQLVMALSHLRAALETDPSDHDDHVRVIQLQLRLHRAQEAAFTAKQAQKLFPDSPTISMLLAMSLTEAKHHLEAVEAFATAERLYSIAQQDALTADFYLTYGAAAERAGLLEKAATLLKKSIALNQDNPAEALNYLAYMWIDRSINLDEAGELVRQALTLRPNHPAYLDSLGWWHYRRGDFQSALVELRKAVDKMRREDAGEVYDHLGDVLEKLERPDEALAAWEAAIELDSSLAATKDKVAKLRAAIVPQPIP